MWCIGEAIKNLREANDMSRKDLAALLKVTYKTIGNYENGDREPNLEVITKLSEIFNTSTDYLLTGKTNISTPKGDIHLKFKSGKKSKFDMNMMQEFIKQLEENKIDAEAIIKELNEQHS
ncbi:helix-turn-helix domain-containing protein [Clostridium weizhouense]|uniref:Helix-turn-helix domain-containing protein n=1 Tax=Clostridium weizhouense TaxID=2859781 RepID=A0ABS7AJ86_9CLOT|nr:helix-turn-helix transcriptional regulator [Clostridium weizhouense]MBW6408723.1 helix-turn-helix domain-containing protein [Clostridium weizhouense]